MKGKELSPVQRLYTTSGVLFVLPLLASPLVCKTRRSYGRLRLTLND